MGKIYNDNVSEAQFRDNDKKANQKQKRSSRPGQQAPGNRTGRNGAQKRSRVLQDISLEASAVDAVAAGAKHGDKQWAQRQQRKLQSFAQKRIANRQCMQQYAASQEIDDALEQLQQLTQHMESRMAASIMRHQCHSLLSLAEQQQLQGQLSDTPELHGAVAVVSRRTVAFHELGANTWLSVPTCYCHCCHDTWEVPPAAVGCFASSPDQPWVWFSSKLLWQYTCLKYTTGTGSSNFSDACNTAADVNSPLEMAKQLMQAVIQGPPGLPPLPAIKPWQLETAWQEWRRVGALALRPEALAATEMKDLGPAVHCPACAVTPNCEEAVAAVEQCTQEHTVAAALNIPQASSSTSQQAAECSSSAPRNSQPPESATELKDRAQQQGLLPGTVAETLPSSIGPHIKAVCFDANAKANRYRLAGNSGAYEGAAQELSQFLSSANKKVWSMRAEGPLPVAPRQQRTPEAATDDCDLELDGKCHPKLSCARESSLQSGVSDECGLVGAVCSHGQPLVGMFIAMPAPERLLYYDLLLEHLLPDADVSIMYLDTGCTYAKHFDLYSEEGGPRPGCIKVPWWHAIGHRSQCFLVNSGMYLPGAGRRVGETCEQLWAQAKPLTALTRYMAKPNYLDCWDDFFGFIANNKLADFVPFMLAQHRSLVRKLGECRKACNDLIESANKQGVATAELLGAAVDATQASQAAATPADDAADMLQLMVDYVRTHQQYKVLLELQHNAAALSVAMPNREGRALHARSQDNNTINRLQTRVGQLMAKMQLSDPPDESSSEYKAGLATVRDEELSRIQSEIESQVSELAVHAAERPQQGTASKVTRAQANSMKRRRKRVRELVGVMQTWQQVDAPSSPAVQQLPAVWNEAEVKQLFGGVFPWRQGPVAEKDAAMKALAGQFRDACAEEARCLEELVLQRYERRRVQQYYQHISRICESVAAEKAEEADAVLQEVSASVANIFAGCTAEHKQQLSQYMQLTTECMLLRRLAEQYDSWCQQAVQSFQMLS